MSFLCEAVRRMPLILSISTPIGIFITYGVAVGVGHVRPLFPYISDTGTKPPESCIFSFILGAVAFALLLVVYVKYLQVSLFLKTYPGARITLLWNRIAAVFGILSGLGLYTVACFQETSHFVTHIVGAMLCFFSATLYFLLQTVFTRRMNPEAKCLFGLRITFTLLNVLFIVGTFAPVGAAMKEFKGDDVLRWQKSDGGYSYHLMSTFSEWFLVFSFCAYICTFHWDFRRIKIEPVTIKFVALDGGKRDEEAGISSKNDNAQKLWI